MTPHPPAPIIWAGGGISLDGERWVACRPGFFLPVKVLSRLFRRLFLEALQQAFDQDQLQFPGEIERLREPRVRLMCSNILAATLIVALYPMTGCSRSTTGRLLFATKTTGSMDVKSGSCQ